MILLLVATGFGGYWIWSGIQLVRMPGCSTVGIGGSGRVISASMTLDVYGHLYTEDLEELADRLEERIRGAA